MHCFVTGATGFIGKRLVKSLLARRGAVVHFLMRPGNEGKLADLYCYWGVSKARAIPIRGDLTSPKLNDYDYAWRLWDYGEHHLDPTC